MSDNTCDTCDKKCEDHGTNTLLMKQYGDRLDNAENSIDIMNADNSNTEGRLNMFIWAIGIVFMLIASMSFYGVLQLSNFKEVYMENQRNDQHIISVLTTSVELTNNNVSHMKDDMKTLKKDQKEFIRQSETQMNKMITTSISTRIHDVSDVIEDEVK